MCTAKGFDVRPGVPWGSAAFAWQAWDNLHCLGVGCTPYQQTNSTCTRTRRVTGYLSARVSSSVQNTTDDQVVPVRALVQLLQAVMLQDNLGTDKSFS